MSYFFYFFGTNLFISHYLFLLRKISTGKSEQYDAKSSIKNVLPVISTDPPYYDNIGYADLSDFFYLWLRHSLQKTYSELFSTLLVPKSEELVANPYRFEGNKEKAQSFFEEGLSKAFSQIHKIQHTDYPLTVYYAFKQAETDEDEDQNNSSEITASTGWETMLEGLIKASFTINGTWPVRTERTARSVSIGTNALASSIVLVCRPRPENAKPATRRDFLNSLKKELPDALKKLQQGNIAPVDLAQASIGPGMAIYSRYSKVIETNGSPMPVRTALALINQALDEYLSEQEGEFDSDTRWALAWFEQFAFEEGVYGDAETLSKAKNTSVQGMIEAGVALARSGKVRLIKRDELPKDWDPTKDKRLTIWEATQHLVYSHDTLGETGAAKLLAKLGSNADAVRDLAYRLYSICERKKWAQEAMGYNSLVIAWPEIAKLAMQQQGTEPKGQIEMFE